VAVKLTIVVTKSRSEMQIVFKTTYPVIERRNFSSTRSSIVCLLLVCLLAMLLLLLLLL